jgi:hypothetical protein
MTFRYFYFKVEVYRYMCEMSCEIFAQTDFKRLTCFPSKYYKKHFEIDYFLKTVHTHETMCGPFLFLTDFSISRILEKYTN